MPKKKAVNTERVDFTYVPMFDSQSYIYKINKYKFYCVRFVNSVKTQLTDSTPDGANTTFR